MSTPLPAPPGAAAGCTYPFSFDPVVRSNRSTAVRSIECHRPSSLWLRHRVRPIPHRLLLLVFAVCVGGADSVDQPHGKSKPVCVVRVLARSPPPPASASASGPDSAGRTQPTRKWRVSINARDGVGPQDDDAPVMMWIVSVRALLGPQRFAALGRFGRHTQTPSIFFLCLWRSVVFVWLRSVYQAGRHTHAPPQLLLQLGGDLHLLLGPHPQA